MLAVFSNNCDWLGYLLLCGVEQWLARLAHNQKDVGSNPTHRNSVSGKNTKQDKFLLEVDQPRRMAKLTLLKFIKCSYGVTVSIAPKCRGRRKFESFKEPFVKSKLS